MAEVVTRLVRARANILVAGETGAGKTTFLRSVTDLFDPAERIGVVEDTAELALENPDRFNLETLHPHDLAAGEADTRLLDVGDLVANALRMRPDRLIVGEIRLPKEAFYTLQALHTGHDGSATTIHASSAEDALFRLELLARQSMRDLTIDGPADLHRARVRSRRRAPAPALRAGASSASSPRSTASTDDGGYRLVDVFRAEAVAGIRRDPVRRRRCVDAVAAPAGAPRARGRAMELIGALAAGVAVVRRCCWRSLPSRAQPTLRARGSGARACTRPGSEAPATLLEQARLEISPRTLPRARRSWRRSLLGSLGLLLSVPMAILGLIVGAFVPRWYVRYLVGSEARAAADDAPRVLRAMVNRAAAGGTYPDLYRGRGRGRPPPLGEGRLRGDPRALLRRPRRRPRRSSRSAAARRGGTSRSSTTR